MLPERTAAVLVALYACLCLGPGAASAADPGSIVGEVTASLGSAPDSSSPVAGAVVTATAPSGATAAATTDAAGDYEIDNLPAPRTYTVSFTPPRGYQPTTTPGVDVMPDQSTEANASLVELPSTVTGVVTGRGGQPLAGMVMEAVPIDFPCPSGDVCGPEGTSGPDGRYAVGGLAAGTYDMRVMDAGRSVDAGTVTLAAGGAAVSSLRLGPPPVPNGIRVRDAQRDLAWLNAERARLGLPAGIVLNPRWSTECAAHDAYQREHDVIGHPESLHARGYSPGGAWAGMNSVLAEYHWTGNANPWEDAPIHLIQLFSPSLSVIGIDDSLGRQCATTWPGMVRPPFSQDTITTYPADGARGVPPSEDAEESPFVPGQFVGIPAGRTAGRELFVYLNRAGAAGQASVSIVSARLSNGRHPVRVRWVDNSTSTVGPYLTGAIIIPVKPMRASSNCTATVVVRDGQGTLTRTWSFRTARRRRV